MGYIQKKIDESLKKKGIVELFTDNQKYLYNGNSDGVSLIPGLIDGISLKDIQFGRFHFFVYLELPDLPLSRQSKWMAFSPVFVIDTKEFSNLIILRAINLNFLPLKFRIGFFDKFINENTVNNNTPIRAEYDVVYNELKQIGFEWTIMEFNLKNIMNVYRINMAIVDKFLHTNHPQVIYDENKLVSIWSAKIKNQEKRHKEITQALMSDFFDISGEIDEKYQMLKNHISRLQRGMKT